MTVLRVLNSLKLFLFLSIWQTSSTVMHGEDAMFYPWMARIDASPSESKGGCPGALIARDVVLTSRKCILRLKTERCGKDLIATVGEYKILYRDQVKHWSIVRKIIYKPEHGVFPKDTHHDREDIAIVIMAAPISKDQLEIRPIRPHFPSLLDEESKKSVTSNTTTQDILSKLICYTTGWGRNVKVFDRYVITEYEKVLQQAAVEFADEKATSLTLASWALITHADLLYSKQIKAAHTSYGDAGAPLVCKDVDGDWTLYGIAFTSIMHAIDAFTDVSYHHEWIKKEIDANTCDSEWLFAQKRASPRHVNSHPEETKPPVCMRHHDIATLSSQGQVSPQHKNRKALGSDIVEKCASERNRNTSIKHSRKNLADNFSLLDVGLARDMEMLAEFYNSSFAFSSHSGGQYCFKNYQPYQSSEMHANTTLVYADFGQLIRESLWSGSCETSAKFHAKNEYLFRWEVMMAVRAHFAETD